MLLKTGRRRRPLNQLLIVGTFFCLSHRVSQADVSTSEIRQTIANALSKPTSQLPEGVRLWRQDVSEWLIAEPSRLKWKDNRLTWSVRRQKKMTPEERLSALQSLDELLRWALAQSFPDQSEKIVDQSRLSVAPQPTLVDLTWQQFDDAITRAAGDSSTAALLNAVRSDFLLKGPFGDRYGATLYDPVTVQWTLTPNIRGLVTDGFLKRPLRSSEKRLYDQKLARHQPALREFLRTALGRLADPDLGVPLLDTEDLNAISMQFHVDAGDVAAAAAGPGATGVALVAPSATRGAVDRTVSGIKHRRLTATKLYEAELDFNRSYAAPPDGPPRLTIDTGTFSGAVVNKLAFSPDGRFLAAAGDVVRIWDLRNGELYATLRGLLSLGADGACTDLVFSPSGRQLIVSVAGLHSSLRVYDFAVPDRIREVRSGHDGHVERLAISGDGQWLATYGVDARLQLWNWPERKVTATFSARDSIDHLSFPTDNPNLLSIAGNSNYSWLRVTDKSSVEQSARQRLEQRLSAATQWPDGGAVHPFAIDFHWNNGRWLAGGHSTIESRKRYWVGFWSDDDPNPQTVFDHSYHVTSCALSPDGDLAASADAFGNIYVWNSGSGDVQASFLSQAKPFYSARFERDSGRISFGRRSYRGADWKRNHYGELTETFDFHRRIVTSREPAEPPEAITSHGGQTLAMTRTNGHRSLITQSSEGRQIAALPFVGASRLEPLWHSFLRGRQTGVGNSVVLGNEGGGLVILDPDTLTSLRTFIGHTDRVWCASQSNDNQLLVSASGDGTIRVWRLDSPGNEGNLAVLTDEDGKVHHVFPGTPSSRVLLKGDVIRTIDYSSLAQLRAERSATGKWPFRAGQKVKVELQRNRSQLTREVELSLTGDIARPLFSLFITSDNRDWVIWTPEGYYDASPGGEQLVGWHVNRGVDQAADFYPAEEFRETYYRPKIIDVLFEQNDLPAALNLVQNTTSPNPIAQSGEIMEHRPVIRIMEPDGDLIVGTPEIEVVAEVESPVDDPVESVKILVNGKPFAVKGLEVASARPTQNRGRQKPKRSTVVVRRNISLTSGTNEIQVVAENSAASARSASVWANYRPTVAPDVRRKLYVVAVGVSDHINVRLNLMYAHKDAEDFAMLCRNQPQDIYDEVVEPRILTNDQATKANIQNAMSWLIQNVTPDDRAVFFVSGHGTVDEDQDYYLVTHEADEANLFGTCVPWTDVQLMASKIKGTLIMIADTCHAGGIAGRSRILGNPVHELARDEYGTFVFASSSARVGSMEDAMWENGAMTEALIDILSSPDSDFDLPRDGRLSYSELDQRLDRRVRSLTNDVQRPVSDKSGPRPDIDLFSLPK